MRVKWQTKINRLNAKLNNYVQQHSTDDSSHCWRRPLKFDNHLDSSKLSSVVSSRQNLISNSHLDRNWICRFQLQGFILDRYCFRYWDYATLNTY